MWYKDKITKTEIIDNAFIKPDWELLYELLYRQTPSKTELENQFIDFLSNWIYTQDAGIRLEKDTFGNLYVTKGKSELYPCVVAHVDVNQSFKKDFQIFRSNAFVFGFDNETGAQCGLGFDDKVGVYFALECLKKFDVIKLFFPKSEEVGCIGSANSVITWFNNCSLLIQLDRRSFSNDLIHTTNGVKVMSKAFKKAVQPLLNKYSYELKEGICTDIGELKKRGVEVVAMNVSCGYFNEHGDDEILSINHFINALNFGYEIISLYGNTLWKHKTSEQSYNYPSYNRKSYDWEDWYDRDYDFDKKKESGKKQKKGSVWHHSPGWKFTKDDEEYIEDCLEVGNCPLCNSNDTEVLKDGETYCISCDSIYNIPNNKGIGDLQQEIVVLLGVKL